MKKRKRYSADFKAKVALLALKEELTASQICSRYKVEASQVSRWKKELLEGAKNIFLKKRDSELEEKKGEIDSLYKQVGKLTIQNEFLREKL